MLNIRTVAMIAASALLLGGGAYAQGPGPRGGEPPKTRAEAIEKTKAHITGLQERLSKLEKMTDAQWATEKKARQENREERRAQRMKERKTDATATGHPAAAPAAKQ